MIESSALERDILFKINHQFLVSMQFAFMTDSRIYFVMEYVEGGELHHIFNRQKLFKEDAVRFYTAQIVLGIGKLHENGVCHRDLKLENVMVAANGYLKIVDFGLAKMLGRGQVANSFCGTAEYFAPEMIKKAGHDSAVDWWAVGILIFEMLFGTTPFFSRNKRRIYKKIVS